MSSLVNIIFPFRSLKNIPFRNDDVRYNKGLVCVTNGPFETQEITIIIIDQFLIIKLKILIF